MAPGYLVAVTTVLLCWMLATPGSAVRRQNSACCTSHNRKPIAFRLIKGFKLQSTLENCNINAVIFFTTRNKKICTTIEDAWVMKALDQLGSKLKKMSKPNTGPGAAKVRRAGLLESGPFLNANGTFSVNGTFFNASRTFFNASDNVTPTDATTLSDDY